MRLDINDFRRVTEYLLFIICISMYLAACAVNEKPVSNNLYKDEQIYLQKIRSDFINHKEDVGTINNINSRIVLLIDSLFNGLRKDTANGQLIRGIMNTRSYNLTVLAYKDILNGNYISNADVKLKVAAHTAWFAGVAQSKRGWDEQWDKTARPYIYNYGLLNTGNQNTNLISDPVFRSILWDRRMFAHDAEIYTPRIMASADSVIAAIDLLIK